VQTAPSSRSAVAEDAGEHDRGRRAELGLDQEHAGELGRGGDRAELVAELELDQEHAGELGRGGDLDGASGKVAHRFRSRQRLSRRSPASSAAAAIVRTRAR